MPDGIEADATEQPRRGIAQLVGSPRMAKLVQEQGLLPQRYDASRLLSALGLAR